MRFVALVLQPSAQQKAALAQLLADQQDRSSPKYHQWLSPESYADNFGLNPADMAKIASWLQGAGFTINYEARGRNWIAFSGSTSQMERVFHTQIHRYLIDGEQHYANATPPAVPTALAGIVSVIRGLDDFQLKPAHTHKSVQRTGLRPNLSLDGNNYLAPADLATIYDLNRLYAESINGTGQTIVVIGESDIYSSDIATFRALFGLPVQAFQQTLPCAPGALCDILVPGSGDPGTPSDPLEEADLDLEWVGAVAPNASIIYVNSNNVLSESLPYAVSNNLGPVISMSYGACEQAESEVLDSYRSMVQEANSYGITLLFASGDTGAADCDSEMESVATGGLAVNFPASIPEATSVGGTEFYENGGTYWNSSNGATGGSAISYIPEVGWNDTDNGSGLSSTLAAGGGGLSIYYPAPPWQALYPLFRAEGFRGVPDVAMAASGEHDPYLYCTSGNCVNGSYGTVGGTSAATPVVAGILALVNQYLLTNHVQSQAGLGNVNPTLYLLSENSPSAFHRMSLPYWSNIVPCESGKPDCGAGSFGYNAGPEINLVTGLGSIDAYNLVTSWPRPSTPQITSISPQALSVSTQNQAITVNGNGFQPNLTVTVTFPNNSGSTILQNTLALQGASVNSFVIMISLNTPGTWEIQVNNPDGMSSNQFQFTVNAASVALPDLVVTACTASTTAYPGGAIEVTDTVRNQGTASAGQFQFELYFSPTAAFSLQTAIDTGWGCSVTSLAPNASYPCGGAIGVPPALTPGPWYLVAVADSFHEIVESNENNNWLAATTGPLTVGQVLQVLGAGTDGNLYRISPQSGATTYVGSLPTVMSDIAAYNGVVYAVSYPPLFGNSSLYSINPNTGSGTLIGDTGVFLNALVFNQNGTLYAAGNDSLYTINTATGNATLVGSGSGSGSYTSSGDLMFDFYGNLYLTSYGSSTDQLFSLNVSNGQGTYIGDIGYSSVFGLIFFNNTAFGFTTGGQVLTINLQSGAGTILASYAPVFDGTTVYAPAISPCSYSVSPLSFDVDSTSQSGSVSVTTSPGCPWTATAGGFLSITSNDSVTGNGFASFSLAANTSGVDRTGTLIVAGQAVTILQRATREIFTDVTPPDYYFDFANLMDTDGITAGCQSNPPEYCPNSTTTRGEMAVFIITAMFGTNSITYTSTPYFSDVPPSNPFFKFIQKLRDLGITSGCGGNDYCPNDPVTRAEMAVFIIAARYGSIPLSYPATPYFTDVPASSNYFPFIQKMAQMGITAGCGGGQYCPNDSLTRGQMAVFIVTGLLDQLVPATTPIITQASPNGGYPGEIVTVTLTGIGTHFGAATQVIVPAGITALNIDVLSPTSLTVQLSISLPGVSSLYATNGRPYTIVVDTGSEEADLPNGFIVE